MFDSVGYMSVADWLGFGSFNPLWLMIPFAAVAMVSAYFVGNDGYKMEADSSLTKAERRKLHDRGGKFFILFFVSLGLVFLVMGLTTTIHTVHAGNSNASKVRSWNPDLLSDKSKSVAQGTIMKAFPGSKIVDLGVKDDNTWGSSSNRYDFTVIDGKVTHTCYAAATGPATAAGTPGVVVCDGKVIS